MLCGKVGPIIIRDSDGQVHQDLNGAPVFDSVFAATEEACEQFWNGVAALPQAMVKKPFFGELPAPEEMALYGSFWSGLHI